MTGVEKDRGAIAARVETFRGYVRNANPDRFSRAFARSGEGLPGEGCRLHPQPSTHHSLGGSSAAGILENKRNPEYDIMLQYHVFFLQRTRNSAAFFMNGQKCDIWKKSGRWSWQKGAM
jgi:hypothetical protein